jgi:hypothetical protein
MVSQVIPTYPRLANIAVASTDVLPTRRIQQGCAISGIDSPQSNKFTKSSYGRIRPARLFSLFNLFRLSVH